MHPGFFGTAWNNKAEPTEINCATFTICKSWNIYQYCSKSVTKGHACILSVVAWIRIVINLPQHFLMFLGSHNNNLFIMPWNLSLIGKGNANSIYFICKDFLYLEHRCKIPTYQSLELDKNFKYAYNFLVGFVWLLAEE